MPRGLAPPFTASTALVVSLEDALVQRLHEFLATGDFDATVQAIAMLGSHQLDAERLKERVVEEDLRGGLEALRPGGWDLGFA